MSFIDSSDIKFGTFFSYIFHNMVNEIESKKYQQNCGQSFWDGGSNKLYTQIHKLVHKLIEMTKKKFWVRNGSKI